RVCKNTNRAIAAELNGKECQRFKVDLSVAPQIPLVELDPRDPKLRLQESDELSKVAVGMRPGRTYDSRTAWFVVVSSDQEHIPIALHAVIMTTVLIP
ncbi:hypothetical protein, partial [Pseudomonas reactans]|uniref:hypothetical protein n=1 Tax=Pseudomonas reactans TaxID=117680 RepID=UPI001C43018D